MNEAERERYSRQILFPGIGDRGQEALLRAHAVIAGSGALGSFHAAALARAGVGTITIIDRDYVEPSNLHRQWLFEESDAAAALPKAAAAERCLARINSRVRARGIVADLTASNAQELLGGADVILDGTDNFETRYLINDFAVSRGIPWIYGAAVGSYGLTMPVIPGHTACLRCVYPDPPAGAQPTCETAGVLNPIVSAVASLQVADAMRILVDPAGLRPRITTIDVWSGAIRQIDAPARDPDCPTCGRREFPFLEESRRQPVSLCGRNAVQVSERERPVDLLELKARLEPLGEVRANQFALRFFIPPYEMTVFADGRAIIKGTSDTGVARSLYARYVG
ncbi:MAG TPA: ThiF family adenylyltransferase [Candidatus Acidoferrales bacterium]|jgi:molybdopterin/thiamine biosynthesis adenylyltransferase|nr:ThiF family adenylyltransferase [Candidatus Acidoferrales bacterium]